MADAAKPALPHFPIQLLKVDIAEIAYSCAAFSDSSIRPTEKFALNVAVSPYESATKTLQVALSFKAESDETNPVFPHNYSLEIKVHGIFCVVDEPRVPFPIAEIGKWAEKNGVLIMLPFLRESVYTITQKTGFGPLMLPMVEISSFRVGAPNHAVALPVRRRAHIKDTSGSRETTAVAATAPVEKRDVP